jgi:ribosomal protein L7/L12
MDIDKDAMDRGLHRLLVEERERIESEMRADMARARVAAGDNSVTISELAGEPYNRIKVLKLLQDAWRLPLREAKALVDAYKGDRVRTIAS